ncbi:hypothetical protein MKK55_18725 [Methylobacterium sp. J-059]|uniref:hypothetical protein n=1 Tax=Methylobacterium sp. J-059 TaxID=2836643 RepID=UPI001FBC0A91|nr:hypothetical protein [Methylobacterium sp. J-059]MCJ2040966.1 hypothetical protein [Methylobacterium sp. J-059]
MTDRARCAVPFCRRTASVDEGFRDGEFLCGPHWRLRSPATKAAWRDHARLERRNPGHAMEHPAGSAGRLVRVALAKEERALWEATRAEVVEVAMGVSA